MAFVKMDCPVILPAGQRLSVEVVETLSDMREGLRGRASLGPDEGMLFVYTRPGYHQFTMAGMAFPLDMLWISPAFRIAELEEHAQPGSRRLYGGHKLSAYALELPAGSVQRFGLKIGQQLMLGGFNG